MIIHPRFIFARVPRTGGKFLQEFLIKHVNDCDKTPNAHFKIDDLDKNILKGKFRFGVVRNPFDWYISWWKYNKVSHDPVQKELFQKGRDKNFNLFIKHLFSRTEGRNRWFDLGIMNKLDIGLLSFKYIKVMFYYNCIFYTDFPEWIRLHNDLMIVSDIIRFENFKEEVCDLFDRYNFPLEDEVRNKLINSSKTNSTEHFHYSEYYNNESIELVKHKDRFIFDNHNYIFEVEK